MPEITIYTNDGDCANSVAELNPFTVGDTTNDWTLKFVNEDGDFYAPSNVTMRVGHTNGLPDGTYNNAFKWVDRADNESTGSIVVSSGVPTLSFNTNPAGGVVGTNGVYLLRGPQLDGSITSVDILDKGAKYLGSYNPLGKYYLSLSEDPDKPAIISVTMEADPNANPGGGTTIGTVDHFYYKNTYSGTINTVTGTIKGAVSSDPSGVRPEVNPSFVVGVSGDSVLQSPSNRGSRIINDESPSISSNIATSTGAVISLAYAFLVRTRVASVTIEDAGLGYTKVPDLTLSPTVGTRLNVDSWPDQNNIRGAKFQAKIAYPQYEFPFKRDESGNDIIAATTLSPYSDGKIDATTQYDHSTLVIRPETVATASLTQSGTDWVGTMNPVNAYVTERLALRNSTQLDLQIRGDGRTLFQGQLTVLNKIA
jgi:hypothetical protein